jgi:hypothetical protein
MESLSRLALPAPQTSELQQNSKNRGSEIDFFMLFLLQNYPLRPEYSNSFDHLHKKGDHLHLPFFKSACVTSPDATLQGKQ